MACTSAEQSQLKLMIFLPSPAARTGYNVLTLFPSFLRPELYFFLKPEIL